MSDVTIQGYERLKLQLRRVIAGITSGGPAAERLGSEVVAARWQALAPVRTGRYRRSIQADEGFAGTSIRYARPVEARTHVGWTAANAAKGRVTAEVTTLLRRHLPT